MPGIDIKRSHTLPLAQARRKVQRVADHIAAKFDVACEWDGDVLHFRRTGVEGEIRVTHREVHVLAQLGFLLSALRGTVEREVGRYLDEEFG